MATTAVDPRMATPQDVAYLLFGQAIPHLGVDDRLDVVIALGDGDFDVALGTLTRAIDGDGIAVDPDLLGIARTYAV